MKVVLAGFRYVWSARLLLGAMSLDLFVVLLGGAVALMPIFASDILHTGPRGLGMLRAAPAIGALAMSLLMARFPISRRAGRADVCRGGNLWRGDGGLWAFAEPVALAGGAGRGRRGRHDQRDYPRLAAATGDSAGDARTSERGQLAVHWRIQ